MKNKFSHIRALIDNYRIAEAIDAIRSEDKWKAVSDELRHVEDDYGYMLAYFRGLTDTSGVSGDTSQLRKMQEQLRTLLDHLDIEERTPGEDNPYFALRRSRNYKRQELSLVDQIKLIRQQAAKLDTIREMGQYSISHRRNWEQAEDELFSSIWISFPLGGDEQEALVNFLTENESETLREAQMLTVSALLLGSLRYFDRRALSVLMHLILTGENAILTARALTAATLIAYKNAARLYGDEAYRRDAAAICDIAELTPARRALLTGLARTLATERAGQHVKEKIMPTIQEMKPMFDELKKQDITTSDSDGEPEINPAWEEAMQKSGLDKRIEELGEMQSDGLDVYMSAFTGMKQFPFFRTISNWLLPFTPEHSAIHEACEQMPTQLIDMMQTASGFCSSDVYSMLSAIKTAPGMPIKGLFEQMSQQMQEMSEVDLNQKLERPIEKEIGLYLRDLYRLFSLKPEVAPNPLTTPPHIGGSRLLSDLSADTELRNTLAEFYFKYGYWRPAIDEFSSMLAVEDDADAFTLQKIAFSYEQLGQTDSALEYYRRAELIDTESVWLMRRIADILVKKRQFVEAADYLQRALDLKPESTQIMLQLAQTLVQLGSSDEAIKLYYQVKYLKPNNQNAIRGAAWCEFLQSNHEKALSLYQSLNKLTANDLINIGHLHLAKGEISAAAESYTRAYRISGRKDFGQFRDLVIEDMPVLSAQGVHSDLLTLVLNMVYMDTRDLRN